MDIVKVGIIGVYPSLLGGYDDTPIKIRHRQIFRSVLALYNNRCVGLSGMTIGSELDFAEVCYQLNVPFQTISIQQHPSHKWLVDKSKFDFLMTKTLQHTILSEGAFSPIKVMRKWEYIIRESDVIIYVSNDIYTCPSLIQMMYDSGKTIFPCVL